MSYFSKRPTARITLPSDKSLWVDVYTKFTWKQEKAVGIAILAGTQRADAILQNVIADWNLTDDENNIAPIDNAHIDELERADAIAILNGVNDLEVVDEDKEAKKSSSNASPER